MSTMTAGDAFVATLRKPLTSGNAIRDMNPVNILIIMVAFAVYAIVLPGMLVAPLAVCAACVLVAVGAGIGRGFGSLFGKLFGIVGGTLFILRAIFLDDGHVFARFGPFVISAGGIMQALRFSLVVMALCGALVLFFQLVPMKNLMLALESKGASPRATYVILASFQAIIDLGKNARTVMDAQRSRGIETEGSLGKRLRAFGPVLIPVFLAAMNQTEERALALDARAFNAPGRHTHLARLRRTPAWEAILTVVAAAAAVFTMIGAAVIWA